MKTKLKKVVADVRDLATTASTVSVASTMTAGPPEAFYEAKAKPEIPAVRRKRRPGPWRILEIFTWTVAVSIVAHSRGWEAGEPLTLPGFDFLKEADQKKAEDYIASFDPDLVLVAWPSTKWSVLQTFGFKTQEYLERLAKSRNEQRRQKIVLERRALGCATVGENPFGSRAWKEPVVINTWAGLPIGKTEMCAFGLNRPTDEWLSGPGLFLRKPPKLAGPPEVLRRACRLCRGNHRHAPCLGRVKVKGRWCSLAEFASGYTPAFARALVVGA